MNNTDANQQLKLAKYKKIGTNFNLMSCNSEPSVRREGVLRGRAALRREAVAPQKILCKRYSTKSRISHNPCV